MKKILEKYNKKRNFDKTKEPKGLKKEKQEKKLSFIVQHHIARKDHYDFRLEWNGVLLSWAVPKGPSFNSQDKRLAIHVEDHPLTYANFEGTIPKGEYGGGTVMLWDKGYWKPYNKNVDKSLKNGSLKFELFGERLVGKWALVKIDDDKKQESWLLIKEKDNYENSDDINNYNTSVKTGLNMSEIENGLKKNKGTKNKKEILNEIKITNPQKMMFDNIKKIDIVNYYISVAGKMLPYLERRITSIIRCPKGKNGICFFKKHPSQTSSGVNPITIKNSKNEDEEFFYIEGVSGLVSEVQMNTIEFHIWGSKIDSLEKPDYMVFDLDPDEKLGLKQVRQGVKDLKSILDELGLISFLKTSGGKGYHIVVPFIPTVNWENFYLFAKNIARLMEEKYPDKYTSNMRKIKRKSKIFIDAERNTRGATSVVPYSIRAKNKVAVSMPISWKELDKIAPNDITMFDAISRIKKSDPWKDFFKVKQQLK